MSINLLSRENGKILNDVLSRTSPSYEYLIVGAGYTEISVQMWLPLKPCANPLGNIYITVPMLLNRKVIHADYFERIIHNLVEMGLRLNAHPPLQSVFLGYHKAVIGTDLELPFSTHIAYTAPNTATITSLLFPMQDLNKWIPSAPFSVALPLAVSVAAHRAQSLVVGKIQ